MNAAIKKIKRIDAKKILQIIITSLMVASLVATPVLTVLAIVDSN
jgi:uncharacterized membrane protein